MPSCAPAFAGCSKPSRTCRWSASRRTRPKHSSTCVQDGPMCSHLLDVVMPGRSGIDALPEIREAAPDTRVLMLSMQDDSAYVRQAFANGASGYLLKDAADDEFSCRRRISRRGRRTKLRPPCARREDCRRRPDDGAFDRAPGDARSPSASMRFYGCSPSATREPGDREASLGFGAHRRDPPCADRPEARGQESRRDRPLRAHLGRPRPKRLLEALPDVRRELLEALPRRPTRGSGGPSGKPDQLLLVTRNRSSS